MTSRRLLLLLSLIGLTGCGVASVSPAVTDGDVIFDPRLLGTWQDSARTESAVVTAAPEHGYQVVYTDADRKIGRFHARLGLLGPRAILDLQPDDPDSNATDLYKSFLLRAHGLLFIDSLGPEIRFRQLNGDSLVRYLDRNPQAIAHANVNDAILLTAPSADVRQFLSQLVRQPGMLSDPVTWRRKTSPDSTRVVMLGTGTPNADPDRSGPAVAIVVNGQPYIVDAGPGVVRRAAAAARAGNPELRANKLDIVFITHLHSDHTVGLPDLLLSSWVLGRAGPLRIFGPRGTSAMVDHISAAWAEDIHVRLTGGEQGNKTGFRAVVTEVDSGIVYRDTNVTVTAFRVSHGTWDEALGYKFVTRDRVIVISGDTRPTDAIVAQCNGCDVLIHEVYLDSTPRPRPQGVKDYDKNFHTSTLELGDLATRAKPKLLLLYHQLYRGGTDDDLLREIKTRYAGLVLSARDLGVY